MDIYGHVLAAVDDGVSAKHEALYAIARDTPVPPARHCHRPVRPHSATASIQSPAERSRPAPRTPA
jgi:hypothetical protein